MESVKVPANVIQASIDQQKACINLRDGFYKLYPKVPGTKGTKIYADHILGNLGPPIQASWTKKYALDFVTGVLAKHTEDRKIALMNITADGDIHYKAYSAENQPSNYLSKKLQAPGGVEEQLWKIKAMLE